MSDAWANPDHNDENEDELEDWLSGPSRRLLEQAREETTGDVAGDEDDERP